MNRAVHWLAAVLGLCISASAAAQIVVGQTAGFSGPVAAGVKEISDGAKLYLDNVNAQGGVNGQKIEVVAMDDKFDPKLAAENAKALITADGLLRRGQAVAMKPQADAAFEQVVAFAARQFLAAADHIFAVIGVDQPGIVADAGLVGIRADAVKDVGMRRPLDRAGRPDDLEGAHLGDAGGFFQFERRKRGGDGRHAAGPRRGRGPQDTHRPPRRPDRADRRRGHRAVEAPARNGKAARARRAILLCQVPRAPPGGPG